MMKFFKQFGNVLVLSIIAFVVLGMFVLVNADYLPQEVQNDYDNNYQYLSYSVDINVQQDNSYNIKETILTEFAQLDNVYYPKNERRGIYRYIPLKNTISTIENGKVKNENYNVRITDVWIEYSINGGAAKTTYHTYNEDGYLVMVIGDEKELVNGKQVEYSINYTFRAGHDHDLTKDFFYYNILGDGRTTYIENFDFSVTMPKSFDYEKANFYVGEYGSQDGAELLQLEFNGETNTIYGTYIGGVIEKDTNITLHLELPENYFNVNLYMPTGDIVVTIITIIILLCLIIVGVKNIANKQIVNKPVEFYPPSNLNPPEAGFLLRGSISTKKMSSLIVYWASKGYLKINAQDEKNIKLYQLVQELPDDIKRYEQNMFKLLFKKGKVIKAENDTEIIAKKDIDKNAKTKVDKLKWVSINNINPDFAMLAVTSRSTIKTNSGGTAVDVASKIRYVLLSLISVIPMMLFGFLYFIRLNYHPINMAFAFVMSIAMFGISMVLSIHYYKNANQSGNTSQTSRLLFISSLIMAVVLGVIFYIWFGYDMYDPIGLKFIIPIVWLIATILNVGAFKLRANVVDEFGRVEGFRNFIEVAEKERIKILAKENPSYFYDVLPYAYVFDISNEFSKKFEGITIPQSEYIVTTSIYDIMLFNMLFNNINTSLTKSIAKTAVKGIGVPAGSRSFKGLGGGFGGFSGGGFGGGGSGSW